MPRIRTTSGFCYHRWWTLHSASTGRSSAALVWSWSWWVSGGRSADLHVAAGPVADGVELPSSHLKSRHKDEDLVNAKGLLACQTSCGGMYCSFWVHEFHIRLSASENLSLQSQDSGSHAGITVGLRLWMRVLRLFIAVTSVVAATAVVFNK